MSEYQIVNVSPAHVAAAVELSQRENWPHRIEDWKMLLDLSEGVVALKDGSVVGITLCTVFGQDVAALNMIIVAEGERGKGVGGRLIQSVMARSDGRELRLVATQEGLPLYQKLGFVAKGRIQQHQGEVPEIPLPDAPVGRAQPDHLATLIQLENEARAADRTNLMKWLAAHGETTVLCDDNGAITGFAVCRAFGRGLVVGPVVADDMASAKMLIQHHLARRPGTFFRIDTPEMVGLGPWLEEVGLPEVGGGIAMLRGEKSPARPPYALCSQALG